MTSASVAGGALEGLRGGHNISVPFCGLFADHGAEVIKIEPVGCQNPCARVPS